MNDPLYSAVHGFGSIYAQRLIAKDKAWKYKEVHTKDRSSKM